MKRFIVSYIDWFDYDLKMIEVQAESEIEALYAGAFIFKIDTSDIHTMSIEEFKQECFNMDCMMSAFEIK